MEVLRRQVYNFNWCDFLCEKASSLHNTMSLLRCSKKQSPLRFIASYLSHFILTMKYIAFYIATYRKFGRNKHFDVKLFAKMQ